MIILFASTGLLNDEESEQEHGILELEDRIRLEKFVELPENVEIPTENLCMGKVICEKQIKINAVHNVLQHSWARYFGVRVQEITRETILLEFDYEKDQKDAMDWSPWAIQGNSLSLKRWQTSTKIYDIQFNMVQFWAQIHGLEIDKFSKYTSEGIRDCIGRVI